VKLDLELFKLEVAGVGKISCVASYIDERKLVAE
jgi:hypothetical protein